MPKSTRARRADASLSLGYCDGSVDVYTGSAVDLRALLDGVLSDPAIVGSLDRYELRQAGAVVDSQHFAGGCRLSPVARALGGLQ